MVADGNAKIAFALVLAAGASTGLGAAVVFIPSLVKLASRRVLAASLGFSAGVMSYVSFIEIFNKSTLSFINAGHEENRAYIYSTCCFFGGVVTMLLMNIAVHTLVGGHHHHEHHDHVEGCDHPKKDPKKKSSRESVNREIDEEVLTTQPGCSSDPVQQLHTFQRMASVLEHEHEEAQSNDDREVVIVEHEDVTNKAKISGKEEEKNKESCSSEEDNEKSSCNGDEKQLQEDKTVAGSDELDVENSEANQKLQKMGLNTALAIGLHNFPEGLATFVAALEDPAVGAVLATAIAIHNIPEGLCVALPIYYATGNRMKAFLWALLSGASEVVAALLGWVILARVFSDTIYAILFGLVAGMMVIISMKELLPTAHQYDPQDTVVTFFFVGGMALMALSLVLFQV